MATTKPTDADPERRRTPLALLALGLMLLAGLGALLFIWFRPTPTGSPQTISETRSGKALFNYAVPGDGAIAGTVRDPAGRPAKALVLVTPVNLGDAAGADEPKLLSATADQAGAFQLTGLATGVYAVSATSPDFLPGHEAAVRVNPGATAAVHLTLGPAGARLSGQVSDGGGGLIAGATIVAEWNRSGLPSIGSRRTFAFRSDAQGAYAGRLQRGHYRVSVHAEGYATGVHWLDLTTDLRKDFALEPGGSLQGRVLTGADGQPVADATVELMAASGQNTPSDRSDPRQPTKVALARSGEDGQFTFRNVPSGTYLVIARKGPQVGYRPGVVSLGSGRHLSGLDVQLGDGLRLSGRVLSLKREPILGVQASLTPIGFQPRSLLSSQTDKEGLFTLEGLAPGPYILRVTSSGHASYAKELRLHQDLELPEIFLGDDTIVTGLVRTSTDQIPRQVSVSLWNGPVRNARPVDLVTSTVMTDDQGRFTVSGLMPGVVWIEAVSEDGSAALGPQTIQAGEELALKLVIGDGGSISGRVSVKGKGPAAGALVRCVSVVLDRRVEADAGGNYTCGALSDGVYDVLVVRGAADHHWYLRQGRSLVAAYGGRQVGLRRGEAIKDVNLEIAPEESSIAGVVQGSDGAPVAGAAVYASREVLGASRRALNERAVDARTSTAADGSFKLQGLPEGFFRVWSETFEGGSAKAEHVAAGEAQLVLRLKSTARLSGAVVDGQGRPIPSYTLRLLSQTASAQSYDEVVELTEGPPVALQTVFDPQGRFEVPNLREGSYELVVNVSDGKFGREAVAGLKSGEQRQGVRVVVGGARGALRGRVVEHQTGDPVKNCQVTVPVGERTLQTTTDEQGVFVLQGIVPGDDLRVRLRAAQFIDDEHVVQSSAEKPEHDLGTLRIVRGSWTGKKAAPWPGWVVEGRATHTVILAVMPGGLAEREGVAAGGVIVAVNGRDAANLGPHAISFLASSSEADAAAPRIRVRLTDGSVREVTLVRSPAG